MTLSHRAAVLTMLLVLIGCNPPDQRLVDFAKQANQQQARQSELVAQQSEQAARQGRELAKATRELVEQDAAARRELIRAQQEAHEQLRVQHAELDEQRQRLQAERHEAAQAAVREPVIAQAMIVFAMTLAALLPLMVTAYALRRLPTSGPAEELLAEAMLECLDASALPSSRSSPSEPRLPAPSPPGLPPNQAQ